MELVYHPVNTWAGVLDLYAHGTVISVLPVFVLYNALVPYRAYPAVAPLMVVPEPPLLKVIFLCRFPLLTAVDVAVTHDDVLFFSQT